VTQRKVITKARDCAVIHRLLGQTDPDQTNSPQATHRARFTTLSERFLLILAVAGIILALAAIELPHRVILQRRSIHSVPFTIGFQVTAPPQWRPGEFVEFRTRDLRPYYPAGTLFTKEIAAVPGDRLTRLGRDFYINGRYVASGRETDSQGRPAHLFTPPSVPVPLSTGLAWNGICREALANRVPDGALFVLGTHERSFDSRYWGLVGSEEIIGRVVALL